MGLRRELYSSRDRLNWKACDWDWRESVDLNPGTVRSEDDGDVRVLVFSEVNGEVGKHADFRERPEGV